MRTDVKFGLAGSVIILILAGWYLSGQEPNEAAIPIIEQPRQADSAQPASRINPNPAAQQRPGSGSPATAGRLAAGRGNSSSKQTAGKPNTADRRTAGANKQKVDPFGQPIQPTPTVESASPGRRANNPARRTASADSRNAGPNRSATRGANRATQPRKTPTTLGAVPPSADTRSNNRQARRGARTNSPAASRSPIANRTPNRAGNRAASGGTETHTAKPGDTLAKLAMLYYGNVASADLLRRANPGITNPNVIPPGTKIVIPEAPGANPVAASRNRNARPRRPQSTAIRPARRTNRSAARPAAARRTYAVKEGDSLYAIARTKLGAGSRWQEIYKLNRSLIGDDPARLKVGMKLILPDD